MPEPTLQELKDSIEELTTYRDRLQKEVLTVAQKLRMPQGKIDKTLSEHRELKQVGKILSQLIEQHKKKESTAI